MKPSDKVPARSFKNCLLRRARLFSVRRVVTLGNTNAQGEAYFSEFFAWAGEAREELFMRMGQVSGLTFHTSEARTKFFRQLLPFDSFEILVWPRVHHMSVSVRFFFVRGSELVAVGDQDICLKASGKLIPIPQAVTDFIASYDPTDL